MTGIAEPRRTGRAGRLLLWGATQVALCAALLLGAELWLRARESHVVSATERTVLGKRFVLSTDRLVAETPAGKRLIPGADVIIRNHGEPGRHVRIRINSLGFRSDEVPAVKPPGEYRILFLGDSITWGDMLRAEDVYVSRAEHHLHTLVPGTRFRAVNAGTSDIGLREELQILEENGLKVRPDLVVLGFYLNDSRPPWGFPGELGARGWLRRHSLVAETVYKQLKLSRWLSQGRQERFRWAEGRRTLDWRSSRDSFLELARLASFDWGAAWDPSSWEVIEAGLQRLRSLGERHGFRVAVVVFPVSYQVYAGFVEDAPQKEMRERAARHGFAYLDLLPLLREHQDEKLFFDHCHPREPANDEVGRAVAEMIARDVIGVSPPEEPEPTVVAAGAVR